MNRKEFAVLTVPDQVNLVNTYLAQNKSMIDIFKRERIIEGDESSVRKRFVKNGYKHNKEKNQYIFDGNTKVSQEYTKAKVEKEEYPNSTTKVTPNTEYSQSTPKVIPEDQYSQSNTLVVPKEKTERLLKLVDQQPELDELLKWWKNEKNIIDIPVITLYKDELTGEVIAKTFKTYKNIIDKFLEFCNVHKEYTQRDLLAMALLEYIQKYKY